MLNPWRFMIDSLADLTALTDQLSVMTPIIQPEFGVSCATLASEAFVGLEEDAGFDFNDRRLNLKGLSPTPLIESTGNHTPSVPTTLDCREIYYFGRNESRGLGWFTESFDSRIFTDLVVMKQMSYVLVHDIPIIT